MTKKTRFVWWIFFTITVFAIVIVFALVQGPIPAEKGEFTIIIEPEIKDLGDVSVAQGEISTMFTLRNDENSDVVINRMQTSCMCTSASIIIDGVESQRFSMGGHGNILNEVVWSATIPAKSQAQLKVYYDPSIHGNARGAITRTIALTSNDPVDMVKHVKLRLNQVD